MDINRCARPAINANTRFTLTKLNSDLYAILKHTGTPLLTTAFYLVADCKTGAMQYANAGHPKPLHLRRAAKQVQPLANSLGKGQAALGLMDDTVYQRSDVRIEPGDTPDSRGQSPKRQATST